MSISLCGIDCTKCGLQTTCNGCCESDGHPFGEACMVAACCKQGGDALCQLKQTLIDAFNALHIEDMDEVTDLYSLKGSFINIDYLLPSGQLAKFWNDNKIYLGNQVAKKNSELCYGIAADETYLMVCQYGQDASNAEIIVWKRWAD